METPQEHRPQERPAWVRVASAAAPVLVPILVPVLLLGVALAISIAGDAEPLGVEPGTGLVPDAVAATGWHQSDVSLVPAGFGSLDPGHASPQALVDSMVAGARQEAGAEPWITGTILSEDAQTARARVYLPLPGHSDDFVAAEQLLEIGLKADGWYVYDAHIRFHCRRAVRASFCG